MAGLPFSALASRTDTRLFCKKVSLLGQTKLTPCSMLFSKQRGKVLMTVSSMDFFRGLCLTITLALAGEASLAEQLPVMNPAITDAPPISGLAPDHITLS